MAEAGIRTALVTGGSRGIGLEACLRLAKAGLGVVLTARDLESGRIAGERLARAGYPIRVERLDVSSPRSVEACARRLHDDGVEIDVLVNNAGAYSAGSFFLLDEDTLTETLDVHLMGAFRTCQAFVPGMAERGYGRVVNVSSGLGAITGSIPSPAAYGVAKAALNALTLVVSAAVPPSVKVNAVCPHRARPESRAGRAAVDVVQCADTATWLAQLPGDGPTGGFFRNREQIAW